MPKNNKNLKSYKTKNLTFRCTPDQYLEIKRYCTDHKLTVLNLIHLGMNKKATPLPFPILKSIKIELARCGSNINQIAKLLNVGNKATRFLAMARIKEIQEIKTELDRLRKLID